MLDELKDLGFLAATRAGISIGVDDMPEILKQYQPVSAERLRTRGDGDWPMFRRTYDGWGYSPLTQITPDNVKRLQSVWLSKVVGAPVLK